MNPTAQPVSPEPVMVTPDSQNQQAPFTPPTRHFSKKMMGIVAVVLIALAIPVTLFVLKQQQTITQQAATITADPNAIALVANRNIYLEDIDAFMGGDKNADSGLKSKALETMIERYLIDDEAKKLGITVSDEEVTTELAKTSTQDLESIRIFTKYQLFKGKITSSQVKYIEADVIDFWLPPFDYPVEIPAEKKPILDRQRAQQKDLLTDIQTRAEKGEDMLAIAKEVYSAFPAFQGILGINGRIIRSEASDALLAEPFLYLVDDKKIETELTKAIIEMKEGEIRRIEPADGSGGKVVKVLTIHDGSFPSYEEWLIYQKSRYVKIYKQL